MTPRLDRRTFFRRSAYAGAGLVALGPLATLVGCASDSDSSSGTTDGGGSDLGKIRAQLPWLKDVQFSGDYLAETNGYWSDLGLGVTLDAGGPNVSAIPTVVASKSLVTQAMPDAVAAAIAQGAKLSIVGAKFQTVPYTLTSPEDAPITTPEQIVGKKIGVQPNNDLVWAAFLATNGIDPSSVDKVVAGFDPSPLANGEVDGWVSFVTDEPITLAASGFANHVMPFGEFGFNSIGNAIVVRTDSLKGEGSEQLSAYLRGLILGWQAAIAEPDHAVEVALGEYGSDLDQDPKTAGKVLAANNLLMTDGGDLTTGLFTVSADRIAATIATVAELEAQLDESVFDMSILEEVYGGATSLS